MPEVFLLAFLPPGVIKSVDFKSRDLAGTLWTAWAGKASENLMEQVRSVIEERLRELVADVLAVPRSL